VGARFSVPLQTGPGDHPASCTMGTGSFQGVKSSWGMTLTPHPLLVLWSRKGRAIPLLPLWAVWPVQSRSACTRVRFTFYLLWHAPPHTVCFFMALTTNKCDFLSQFSSIVQIFYEKQCFYLVNSTQHATISTP